jgi:hypothetical protein
VWIVFVLFGVTALAEGGAADAPDHAGAPAHARP